MKKINMALLLFLLVGCDISHNNLVADYFDVNNKTITMISGSDPLILGMKKILIDNNWEIENFESTLDQSTISYNSYTTRYLLKSDYNQGKDLIFGDFVKEYEFTIIDMDNKKEVVLMYGSIRSVDNVLKEFELIIENNDSE